jgi:hypothetical protein
MEPFAGSVTFVHSAQNKGLRYEARMADGSPLPAWVRCDPTNGGLAVNAPSRSPEALDVVIVARDDSGQAATTALKVNLKR